MIEYVADAIVGAALGLTVAFAATAFVGMDAAAAWLALGLTLLGAARLAMIVVEAMTPDY